MNAINPDVREILFNKSQLTSIVQRVAGEIARDYSGHESKLVLVGILRGAVVFMTDLMRELPFPVEIDFMRVSSYGGGTTSSGKINIKLDLMRTDMEKSDILIVEDIVDSGNTLTFLTDYIKLKGARSVRSCVMFDKPSRREVDFVPDYCGAVIPDSFIVGYGLDYNEKYRTLPYVGILKPEIYGA